MTSFNPAGATLRMGQSTGTSLAWYANYYPNYSADVYGNNYRMVGDNWLNGFLVTQVGTSDTSGIWSFSWSATGAQRFNVNYAGKLTGTNSENTLNSYYFYLGLARGSSGTAGVDWARVRQYASPEPGATVGNQESAPPAPVASFTRTLNPPSGLAPVTVTFTDASTGSPTSWSWNFGDGAGSSSQNPTKTYNTAGNYNVTLTATNAFGSGSASQTINVYSPPVASFTRTLNPPSGLAPVTVTFTDASTGSPTSWSWNFGDGAGSSSQNPTRTYNTPGNYTVTLTATNAFGSGSASQAVSVLSALPTRQITAAYPNLGAPYGNTLQLNGDASVQDSYIRLTRSAPYLWGSAFRKNKITLPQNFAFNAYFSFQMLPSQPYIRGEGLAFVIQRTSNASGGSGELGFDDISPGFAVEFATYTIPSIEPRHPPTTVNQVVIRTSSTGDQRWPATQAVALDLADGQVKHAWVDYNGTTVTVRLGNSNNRAAATVVLSQALDIAALFGGDTGVFPGFTAGTTSVTFAEYAEHRVLSFYFNHDNSLGGIDFSLNGYISGLSSITAMANPASAADSVGSQISALAKDNLGNGMSGQTINFTATAGSLSAASAVTNATGIASVTLTGPGTPAVPSVRASDALGAYAETSVLFVITAPDWLSGWAYRKPIVLVENSGANLTGYQVLLTVDTQSLISGNKLQSGGQDIRFTSDDGATNIPYWIESGLNTPSTRIWVKVPSLSASSTRTVYLYYGSPTASPASSGTATFEFFDDFSGASLDSDKWLPVGSGITVTGSELVVSPGPNAWSGVQSRASFANNNIAFQVRWKQRQNVLMQLWVNDFVISSNPESTKYWYRYSFESDGSLWAHTSSGIDGLNAGMYGPSLPLTAGVRIAGGTIYFFDDSAEFISAGTLTGMGNRLYLVVSGYGLEAGVRQGNYDEARVRKYVIPEPASFVGREEIAPPGFNTRTGSNVTVSDASTGVTLRFDSVTQPGTTTFATYRDIPPKGPGGFQVLGSYYDISTTATYGGSVTVTIPYNDTGLTLEQEQQLRLFHWDDMMQSWVDVTLSVSTANNTITGQVSSLPRFGVAPPSGIATGQDATRVLGQAGFTSGAANRGGGGAAANSLGYPSAFAFDGSGNLWVADSYNNRVLRFTPPFANGMAASLVLGQADFASTATNRGGWPAANSLDFPQGIAFDGSGNLWVADSGNHRVVQYAAPFSNGMAAVLVLGQEDFASNYPNRGGAVAANTLNYPSGIALDTSGNLWVSDLDNHRVLKYAAPSSNGIDASLVLGQADFASATANRGGAAAANTLSRPAAVAFDGSGNLWVADYYNHRVLKYAPSFSNGMAATLVLGQGDFTSNPSNRGGAVAANTLYYPRGVALDTSGNLWVGDFYNHRVLKYAAPFYNGMNAALVLGQANFVSNAANRGGPVAANTLNSPRGVALDASGNLWVADGNNNRLLGYAPAPIPTATPSSAPSPSLTPSPTSRQTPLARPLVFANVLMEAWSWGDNFYGQSGNGTTTRTSPPGPVSNLAGVSATAAGDGHNLALKSDGTVWAWGYNGDGQLGNGTTANSSTPVPVSNLTSVTAIGAGELHSLALKSNGTVWAWGRNNNGQLGNGTTADSSTPVPVSNLGQVTAIAAGVDHNLALKSDGTVWAWGDNLYGQLGNGATANSSTPVRVSGLTGAIAIAAGLYHSLAVRSDGTVWAWGRNNYGQLGNGATANSSRPFRVSGLTGVTAIAAGDLHSLAQKSDGTVVAWGYNYYGQLGNGSANNSSRPVAVSNLTGVTAIAGGGRHSLALKSDGTVRAWGYNGSGQLGDGTTDSKGAPAPVSNLAGVTAITAGGGHSLALKTPGAAPTPTPAPSPSPSPTPTPSLTPTPSPAPAATPTPSPTPTPMASPLPTALPSPTPTATPPLTIQAIPAVSQYIGADGIVYLDIKISRIRNASTDADVPAAGGIGSFDFTLSYPGGITGNAVNIMAVQGLGPFSSPTADIRNASGSTRVNASGTGGTPQAPLTLVRVAPRITGSATASHTLTLTLTGLAEATGGGNIPADAAKTFTVKRGDARQDGNITITDALFIAQRLAGLRDIGEGADLVHAVNGASVWQETTLNGEKLTIADALLLAQMLAGVRDDSFNLL